jgi:DNA-directed RNA polymerase I subunit RPA49
VEVRKVTVRTTLRSEVDELRNEEAQKLTMMAKRNALATEFGSRRSKKALLEMTQNAISRGRADNPDAVKDELVSDAVLQGMSTTTSAMPTKQELEVAVDSAKPRPKANIAAEYAADVYSADSIVGKELLALIPVKDWVDASERGQGVNVSSKFVAKRVVKLCKSKEIQKLKVLKFIALCINFNSALESKGKGPKRVPFKDKLQTAMGEDVPGAVVASIRRTFSSE